MEEFERRDLYSEMFPEEADASRRRRKPYETFGLEPPFDVNGWRRSRMINWYGQEYRTPRSDYSASGDGWGAERLRDASKAASPMVAVRRNEGRQRTEHLSHKRV